MKPTPADQAEPRPVSFAKRAIWRVRAAFNRHRRRNIILSVAFLGCLSAADHLRARRSSADDRSRYQNAIATIVHVADGDTFDVNMADGGHGCTRIRLWGVDCPEIAHAPGEQDMHFGRQAADFVRREILGREVAIELEPTRSTRDRYQRLLAYVRRTDQSTTINETLISEGLAYADTRFPHARAARYERLEREARKSQRGLWKNLRLGDEPGWRQRREHRNLTPDDVTKSK